METWITPSPVVALAALMIGMIRSLRSDLEKRIDEARSGPDGRIDRGEQRMDRLKAGLVEVKEGLAEARGELRLVRDYILRRNAPDEEPPGAPAE